jgi:ribosomal protein L3 glutamine methyltransferase
MPLTSEVSRKPTVGDLIEALSRRFERAGLCYGHGTDNAWDEAVALVLGVTDLPDDRASLDVLVTPDDAARIEAFAVRRVGERLPLAYLLGRCRYLGLEFEIEPGVVVPRSPVGMLVADGLRPWLTRAPERVLDVCCGSGCIGIVAALAFPEAHVVLADVDPRALSLARRNVVRHGLAGRVEVRESDLFAAFAGERFELVLSNPPYVDPVDLAALPPEYAHEPERGLAGGAGGVELVLRMIDALPRVLTPEGVFVCEVGGSAPALLRARPDLPFVWPDLPEGGEGVFILTAADLRG